MNDQEQQTKGNVPGANGEKKEKGKCMMCYYVRIFASIAFVLVLLLALYMRFVGDAQSVGF